MVGVREKGFMAHRLCGSISAQNSGIHGWAGCSCEVFQSNWEGALVDKIHEAKDLFDGAVINAGALTHYSYALRDAVSCLPDPRLWRSPHIRQYLFGEEFRHHSVRFSPVCAGSDPQVRGRNGYFSGIDALKPNLT